MQMPPPHSLSLSPAKKKKIRLFGECRPSLKTKRRVIDVPGGEISNCDRWLGTEKVLQVIVLEKGDSVSGSEKHCYLCKL